MVRWYWLKFAVTAVPVPHPVRVNQDGRALPAIDQILIGKVRGSQLQDAQLARQQLSRIPTPRS